MAWENRGGDTGRMYEAKFMGTPSVGPDFLIALERLPRLSWNEYYETIFDLFKKNYLDDPLEPSNNSHLRELRIAVADALELDEKGEASLRAYSTVGTPIDVKFGTDGFLEFTNPVTGETARVTLDVTINERKLQEQNDSKADIIVGELPDAVQEEDAYIEAIDGLAADIASKLIQRTEPKQERRAS